MEEKIVIKNKKGLIPCIIACFFTLCAIISCIYFGIMIKEHFDLQASAENFEGLGSIGIILVAVIFAGVSIISSLVSSLFSLITIIKSNNKFRIITIITLGLNLLIIITNVILFIVLRQG